MAGLGLFGICLKEENEENFDHYFRTGTCYQQHNGEEAGGASYLDSKGKIETFSWEGLFSQSNFPEVESTHGISFCGSPPAGPRKKIASQGPFSLLASGKIKDKEEKFNNLLFGTNKRVLENKDALEIMAKLLGVESSFIGGISRIADLPGGHNLLFLTKKGIWGFRSVNGRFPLIVGKKDGLRVIGSDPCGFKKLGLDIIYELNPGDLIRITPESSSDSLMSIPAVPSKEVEMIDSEGMVEKAPVNFDGKEKICSFLWVYTAFPSGRFQGVHVGHTREKLGKALAEKDYNEGMVPDIVAPVPDSGRFHATGYFQKMNELSEKEVRYREVLLKRPLLGRSFTRSNHKKRKEIADRKLLPDGRDFSDKSLVIVDDSVVRGTQMKNELVPKLKSMNFSEIHVRISCPALYSYCPWSKSTKEGELFTSKVDDNEMKENLGVESIRFNKIETLISAIGLAKENLCFDCLKS